MSAAVLNSIAAAGVVVVVAAALDVILGHVATRQRRGVRQVAADGPTGHRIIRLLALAAALFFLLRAVFTIHGGAA